jgi:hypothetical protein
METLSGYGGLAGLGQRRAAIMQRDNLADTIRNDATEKMRVAMEGMKQAEAEGNMTKYAALKKEFTDAQNTRATANALAASKMAEGNVQAASATNVANINAGSAGNVAAVHERSAKTVADIHARATILASQNQLNTREAKQVQDAATAELKSAQGEVDKYAGKPLFRKEDKDAHAAAVRRRDTAAEALRILGGGGTMPASPGATPAPAQNRPPLGSFQK